VESTRDLSWVLLARISAKIQHCDRSSDRRPITMEPQRCKGGNQSY